MEGKQPIHSPPQRQGQLATTLVLRYLFYHLIRLTLSFLSLQKKLPPSSSTMGMSPRRFSTPLKKSVVAVRPFFCPTKNPAFPHLLYPTLPHSPISLPTASNSGWKHANLDGNADADVLLIVLECARPVSPVTMLHEPSSVSTFEPLSDGRRIQHCRIFLLRTCHGHR